MHITIAERLKPFSHTPGTYFMLPGTPLRFQLFPGLIRVHDLSSLEPKLISELPLDVVGPVEGFTVMQDLERGCIKVWGHTAKGYMRYRIVPETQKDRPYTIVLEKSPSEQKAVSTYSYTTPGNISRLSLGNHKAQDWTMMQRRADFTEIFPCWHRLGQWQPAIQHKTYKGTASLLQVCQKAIDDVRLLDILPAFKGLFLAGFDVGLSPQLDDIQYQGFHLPKFHPDDIATPLILLKEGSELIHSLFLQFSVGTIKLLPALPPEFHCGRLIQVPIANVGLLDLEWSKKQIRRMILRAHVDASLHFSFQKDLKQFRLRLCESERGQLIPCPAVLELKAGQSYLFDRFQ